MKQLTAREREIVLLLRATGASNKVLAAKLGIAMPTVRLHLSHVFMKLGITNRCQLFLPHIEI